MLSSGLAEVTTPRLRFETRYQSGKLNVSRLELDENDEVFFRSDASLGQDIAAALANTSLERLAWWTATYVRLQDTPGVALDEAPLDDESLSDAAPTTPLLESILVVLREAIASEEALTAAMLDGDLVGALRQAAEPSFWTQDTAWGRASEAAGLGNFVVLEECLRTNPELVCEHDAFGFTLLHQVVERCDSYAASTYRRSLALLIDRGADVEAANKEGLRPAHCARASILPALLQHGANLESRTHSGMTPLLSQACEPDGLEAMRVLLEAGADVSARDADGVSAADFVERRGETDKRELLASYASR